MITGRKLLLADDSITIQKVVSLTFSDEGLEVVAVGNGEHALKQLEQDAPDIVLADAFMPGLNGYELCERIKSDERFRHIPVLLLVGTFEPFNEAEARRVGADDVLTKPFQSIRELIGKVGSLLGGRPADEETPADAQPQRPPALSDIYTTAATSGETTSAPETEQPPAAYSSWEDANETVAAPEPASSSSDAAAPINAYADFGMDDQTIEVTHPRAEESGAGLEYSDTGHTSEETAPPPFSTTPLSSAMTGSDREAEARSMDDRNASEWEQESQPSITMKEKQEEMPIAQPAFGSHITSANGADDVLLDLGEVEPSSSAAETDDFILDLADDVPATAHSQTDAGPAGESGSFAGSFTPATVTDTSSVRPGVRPGEPSAGDAGLWTTRPAPPAAGAPDEVENGEATRGSAVTGTSIGRSLTPDQLSPEVIDAIARRAVEQLSEKVVQEIAWEVVPQLAELLIKQRLDEEKSRSS